MNFLFAQTTKNPFSELGYKKQITYTSSKGKFEEFHDKANIVEIGSVYFNTKTNKVVGYVDEQNEETEVASATSAMSVDPLCEQYYWISPYAYCLNNPVNAVDPDGRWVLNLVSAIGNAALDYGSQVAVNMATGSIFKEALTKDISVGSIVMSGVEGAINPIGATTKNLGKTTLKTIARTTLKEGASSASGQVIDNVIKGEGVLQNVGSEFIVGGATGNLKISTNNNNANVTIDKMNKKLDKGKTLTSGQQKQLNSAVTEKKTNVAAEVLVNTSVKTTTNTIKENEKK